MGNFLKAKPLTFFVLDFRRTIARWCNGAHASRGGFPSPSLGGRAIHPNLRTIRTMAKSSRICAALLLCLVASAADAKRVPNLELKHLTRHAQKLASLRRSISLISF